MDLEALQHEYMRLFTEVNASRALVPSLKYERDTLQEAIAAVKDTSPDKYASVARIVEIDHELQVIQAKELHLQQVVSQIQDITGGGTGG
jgi:hypothetical protein